jgi:hypothetical protein
MKMKSQRILITGLLLALNTALGLGQADSGRLLQYKPTGKTVSTHAPADNRDASFRNPAGIYRRRHPGARNGNVVFGKAMQFLIVPQKEPLPLIVCSTWFGHNRPHHTSVLLLIEFGQIRLMKSHEVHFGLPPFVAENGVTAEVPTIVHLLTHTSGLRLHKTPLRCVKNTVRWYDQ